MLPDCIGVDDARMMPSKRRTFRSWGDETMLAELAAPPASDSYAGSPVQPKPLAVVEAQLARAIQEAAKRRKRAAVMLIGFAPACACNGSGVCWDLRLADLLSRAGRTTDEWGPLRLDETTLVAVCRNFDTSEQIQRRAAAILDSMRKSVCIRQGGDLQCAIGIGLFPEDGDSPGMLITRAFEALTDLRLIRHQAASFSLRRKTARRSGSAVNEHSAGLTIDSYDRDFPIQRANKAPSAR